MKDQYHPNEPSPKLMAAVATLAQSLKTVSPARCWGCGLHKLTVGAWVVAAYSPGNPAHPPIAYLLCPTCASNGKARKRAARAIEAKSRDIAEQAGRGNV